MWFFGEGFGLRGLVGGGLEVFVGEIGVDVECGKALEF